MSNQTINPPEQKFFLKDELKRMQGTHFVKVSPALATRWLELNPVNRRLNRRHIIEYVNRMKNGEWSLNGETIKFSSDGLLIDGQHRLAAAIEFGGPIDFEVRFGLPPESFKYIDDGQPRGASELFYIKGETNHALLAGASRFIHRIEIGQKTKNREHRPSNASLLDWVDKNPSIREISSQALRIYHAGDKILPPSKIAGFLFLFSEKDPKLANDFFEKLILGYGIKPDTPISLLRRILYNSSRDSNKRLLGVTQDALVIKAWNNTREGKMIKQLKYSPGGNEKFPEIV